MKRFLLFVGVGGAAIYMFASPQTAPVGGPKATQAMQPISGPLRTSWASTLQALRQEPVSSQELVSARPNPAHGSNPRMEGANRYLMVGGSGGDPLERGRAMLAAYSQAKPSPTRSYYRDTELWIIGPTIGWVQSSAANALRRGWASSGYVAPINDMVFAQTHAAETAKTPLTKKAATTKNPSRVATASKPQRPSPTAKLSESASHDTKVAKPLRPRGLFTSGGDGRRGLLGLFRGRKAERRAWSFGQAG